MLDQKVVIHIADYRVGSCSIVDGFIEGLFKFRVIPVSWNMETIGNALSGHRGNLHREDSPVCILVSPPFTSTMSDYGQEEGDLTLLAIAKFFPRVPLIWETKEEFGTPCFARPLPKSESETLPVDHAPIMVAQRLMYLIEKFGGVPPVVRARFC